MNEQFEERGGDRSLIFAGLVLGGATQLAVFTVADAAVTLWTSDGSWDVWVALPVLACSVVAVAAVALVLRRMGQAKLARGVVYSIPVALALGVAIAAVIVLFVVLICGGIASLGK